MAYLPVHYFANQSYSAGDMSVARHWRKKTHVHSRLLTAQALKANTINIDRCSCLMFGCGVDTAVLHIEPMKISTPRIVDGYTLTFVFNRIVVRFHSFHRESNHRRDPISLILSLDHSIAFVRAYFSEASDEMLPDLKAFHIWFVTGSQNLYGASILSQVNEHSSQISAALNADERIPVTIVFKPVLTSASDIVDLCRAANGDQACIGLILWMHTFSPAKMWINGLKNLHRPFVHLHTQFNRDIPWQTIDMDFMNLNQSAHGDREFGHLCSRMRLERKVITGHWQETNVREQLAVWMRAACAWADWQGARFVRFGDNMRDVSVTEGDKVEAELKFGYSVNTHGVGDLLVVIEQIHDDDIDRLCRTYEEQYDLSNALKTEKRESLREAARIELALRKFLQQGNYKGFTDTFEVSASRRRSRVSTGRLCRICMVSGSCPVLPCSD